MNENQFNEDYGNVGAHTNVGADPAGAAERAKAFAQDARTFAQDTAATVKTQAGEAYHRGEEYVRTNPVPVVLGALAIGLLVGLAIARREEEEPTARERYLDEPLHQTRDALYSILGPVAKRIRHGYGDARSSLEKAADRAQDLDCEPFFKNARRFGDKLKFW